MHEQLPLDPATPGGMLMVVLRRQRMSMRDANLLPAYNATIDAGKRRNIAGRVFLIEDVATVQRRWIAYLKDAIVDIGWE